MLEGTWRRNCTICCQKWVGGLGPFGPALKNRHTFLFKSGTMRKPLKNLKIWCNLYWWRWHFNLTSIRREGWLIACLHFLGLVIYLAFHDSWQTCLRKVDTSLVSHVLGSTKDQSVNDASHHKQTWNFSLFYSLQYSHKQHIQYCKSKSF